MGGRIAHLVVLSVLMFGHANVIGQQLSTVISQKQEVFSSLLPSVVANSQPVSVIPSSIRPNTAMSQQNIGSVQFGSQLMSSALPNTGPLPTYIFTQQASSAVPATNQLTSTLTPEQPSTTTTTPSSAPTATFNGVQSVPVRSPTVNTIGFTIPRGPISTPQIASVAAPLPPIRVQVAFVNSYNSTAGLPNGVNNTMYVASLVPGIANACRISNNRITDVSVLSQPDTGFLVARFTIQSPSLNCIEASCDINVQKAFDLFRSVASDGTLIVRDYYGNNLTVAVINFNPQVVAWTDNGPCPFKLCQHNEICDCSVTGDLYCRVLTSSFTSSNLLYLLLLLLLIPIVVVIVVLVIVLRRRQRKQRQQPLKKVNLRADMLSYKEYVTRQEKQPKVATISSRYNDDSLGTMFRSLGENISIAFNGTTFVDPNNGTTFVDSNDDISSGASIETNDTALAE